MISGTTEQGFEFNVDEMILNDWRFLNAVVDVDSGDASRMIRGISDVSRLILGDEGIKELQNFISEKNDGYIPIAQMEKTMLEIISSLRNGKK